jgi:hypothetical protein
MTHDLKFDAETYGEPLQLNPQPQWIMLGTARHQPVYTIDAAGTRMHTNDTAPKAGMQCVPVLELNAGCKAGNFRGLHSKY